MFIDPIEDMVMVAAAQPMTDSRRVKAAGHLHCVPWREVAGRSTSRHGARLKQDRGTHRNAPRNDQ
ncbi:hypothetical protein [Stenotrophomonas humi]|uniref:hypothetical protein n=1 Tax=Stenotrophomonas humi TaxID=405444 RepID=UPI000A62DE14|nr:hypothetical protein [Stenotrophomonas humi]